MTERQQRARQRFGLFLAIVVICVVGNALGAFNSEPSRSGPTTHATTPQGACKNVDLAPCNTPLRERLMRAAEHLPAGASVEEMTEQAQLEAESGEP